MFYDGILSVRSYLLPEAKRERNMNKKRLQFSRNLLLSLSILTLFSLLAINISETKRREERFIQVREYLRQDSLENYDTEREIMTLSFISEGLLRRAKRETSSKEELSHLSRNSVELALKALPFVHKSQKFWKDQGLLLAHLNIIIGSYFQITKDTLYSELNRSITVYLAGEMTDSPYHTMKSYPEMEDRWPVDNAAILYSIYLYDQNFDTIISTQLISNWLKIMNETGTDSTTQLHVSEITGCEEYSRIPRGCSLSLTSLYMNRFAPAEAKHQWRKYKREMKKTVLLIAGFREYPKGSSAVEDYDSGPIVLDFGGAATGLALPAAVFMKDKITAWQIRNGLRLMDLIIWISKEPTMTYERNTITAQSILFLSDQ